MPIPNLDIGVNEDLKLHAVYHIRRDINKYKSNKDKQ